MIDADLDFCQRQIEAQLDEIRPVEEAMKQANQDLEDAVKVVEEAKKEKTRCTQVVAQLRHKLNLLRSTLGQMQRHKHQLKTLKKMIKYQNDCVAKEEKKCQK